MGLAARLSNEELSELAGLVTTIMRRGYVPLSGADVSNPPADGELDTAFGTPAALSDGGRAFVAMLDDDGGDANVYLVGTNGTSWWYVAMTKAV
ncbi:MAG: hypothetical protein JXA14_26130 [Anaerolineae bacterium]|nr:hypothetical protein [Anaerolineae bacterium]